jgi:integrase
LVGPTAELVPVELAAVNVAALDPGKLAPLAAEAVAALLAEGESANTIRTYQTALRYWAAWFSLRFGRPIALPVPAPAVLQFVVDHAERTTSSGLKHELPAQIDQALVDTGFKARLGPPALGTLTLRMTVLSKIHQIKDLANPCNDVAVKELLAKTRRAYAKRGVKKDKKAALTREPLEAALGTCDDTLRGKRDRALLLFAWSSGGRRRSEVASATMENTVRVRDDAFVFTMAHSKTNQSGADQENNDKPLVGPAAAALNDWLLASKIKSGAIFRRIRRGDLVAEPLSPSAVRDIVKMRCEQAGLQLNYSAHSLRSGFVTEAARQGVPLGDTMAMTGHVSVPTVMGYFQTGSKLESQAAQLLGKKSDSPGGHSDRS